MIFPRFQTRSARPAFTLLELLVVIAIIATLTALSAAGYFYWVGNQQRRNTETQMRPITKAIQEHWNAVLADARSTTPPDAVKILAGANQNLDPSGDRAKVLWAKIRLMEAFPASYSDITANPLYSIAIADVNTPTNLLPLVPQPKYRGPYQKALAVKSGTTSNPYSESAACLLIALTTVNRGGSQTNADTFGPAVGDSDGDNVKEFIDGYGSPIAFYRFGWTSTAANSPNLQALNPAPTGTKESKFADSIDKGGTLLNGNWQNNNIMVKIGSAPATKVASGTAFENALHKLVNPAMPATTAQYIVPTLVSAGADKQFGLSFPSQVATSGVAVTGAGYADNVYAYSLKD